MWWRCLCIFLVMASACFGEDEEPSLKEVLENKESLNQPEQGIDEYNRDTPRGAIAKFLQQADMGQFDVAVEMMDFRNLPQSMTHIDRQRLAYQLYSVLENTVWVDMESLSEDPQGDLDDGLPSFRDRIARLDVGAKNYDIFLQRVPGEHQAFIWKISNATVKHVPELYQHYGNSELGEWLEKHTPKVSFLNVDLWQWILFVGVFLLLYLLLLPIAWLVSLAFRDIEILNPEETLRYIRGPLCLFIAVIVYRLAMANIQMPISVRAIWEGGTILILSTWWMLIRSFDLYLNFLHRRWIKAKEKSPSHLIGLARVCGRILITIVLVLVWLENLGFSATTIVAGLGIGGIAFALAAQKTLENVIGAIILFTAKPVKVGQLCRFGTHVGVVEVIGLRSSCIRTLDRTLINIPNSKLADSELENISERESIRFQQRLCVQYPANSQALTSVVSNIKALLQRNDKVDEEGLRVHMVRFSEMGYEIAINCYINTTDFFEYMDVGELLNLQINDCVQEQQLILAVRKGDWDRD